MTFNYLFYWVLVLQYSKDEYALFQASFNTNMHMNIHVYVLHGSIKRNKSKTGEMIWDPRMTPAWSSLGPSLSLIESYSLLMPPNYNGGRSLSA